MLITMDQVNESSNVSIVAETTSVVPTPVEPFRLTVFDATVEQLVEVSTSPDGTKFYSISEFDKNVLQGDFIELFDRYFARRVLFDRVNNTITIIYVDAMATVYAVKYHETHVERQKYTLLRGIVELHAMSLYQPKYKLINDMLEKTSISFNVVKNIRSIPCRTHLYEYSISDLYRHIPYLYETSINFLISTKITSAYLLDDTLMRMYDIFHTHTTQSTKNLQSKIDALEHSLHEAVYDTKSTKEKLLKSESAYLFLKNSDTYINVSVSDLNDKIQKLTTENEQLRAAMSKFQASMAAVTASFCSMKPFSDQK